MPSEVRSMPALSRNCEADRCGGRMSQVAWPVALDWSSDEGRVVIAYLVAPR